MRASQVAGFFYFVYCFGEDHYTESTFSNPSIIDAVHILTIHKAKGLEFPVVFIPNFVSKRPPRGNTHLIDTHLYPRERYAGNEEDERRLYYTAITRSEKYLFIT